MLKKLIKRIPIIHYYVVFLFRSLPTTIIFNIKKFCRIYNINFYKHYKLLKNFKDKHKGERCFIVATGPSLTLDDLNKIKDEVTFSMNSIVLAFEKTDWRPTYYGIQDENAYRKLENKIVNANMKYIFNGIKNRSITKQINDKCIFYPLNLLKHNAPFIKNITEFSTKFSDDAYKVVYDGYTITYSLMQIAFYMGFKEIYLLGVDCDYSEKKNKHMLHYTKQNDSCAEYLMRESYKVAKIFADENNIKIYNASTGGSLDVFARVDIDEILK